MKKLILLASIFPIHLFASSYPHSSENLYSDSNDEADIYASTSEEDLMGYDSIVKDLIQTNTQNRAKLRKQIEPRTPDSIDNSVIHAGVAFANMFETIDYNNEHYFLNQGGVQISLGIDLFSEHISAEGTMASFGEYNYDGVQISAKEFSLNFIAKEKLSNQLQLRGGMGITGRYLSVISKGNQSDYSTPSSIFLIGGDYYVSNSLSLGTELAMKNAITGETIDTRSYSMLIRLDTHF